MKKTLKQKKYLPTLAAVLVLILLVFSISQFTKFYNDNKEKDIRNNLHNLLIYKKSQLEKALYSRIYYTKGIAAYTSINPKISNKTFYELADKLIHKDSVISTMSLSKDCIINAIYPQKGHRPAIGLNLLEHPQRKKIVKETIRTRKTFVAGPVKLVEGGIGLISYTPIYTKAGSNLNKFWGVTDIVILVKKLFHETHFITSDKKYKYALRGTDGSGENGPVFWGDAEIFKQEPVIVNVLLPTGYWQLASVPVTGWAKYYNKTEIINIVLYTSAFIISILIWLLVSAMLKIRMHEKNLKAIFGSMNDLIIEFNNKGVCVKIAPTNNSLLTFPDSELIGKSLYQIFNEEKSDFFMDAIKECIDKKDTVVIDFELEINSKKLWLLARISYISETSVIFVAHDNTTKKKIEEKLKKSEIELLELNATKDKLFSIIAHDLRSPFNTTLGLIEMLEKDLHNFSTEDIKESIEIISKSLHSQFKLLENLLSWARMQTGQMKLEKKEIKFNEIVNEIIDLSGANAKVKNIKIINEVPENTVIKADENMLRTIIRNLISNAIKFTDSGGNITIAALNFEGGKKIIVSDTGIGMKPEEIDTIFSVDKRHSSLGTNGEKGTGLGLVLVKEMVEKHKGNIFVKSEVGRGTDFVVTLP